MILLFVKFANIGWWGTGAGGGQKGGGADAEGDGRDCQGGRPQGALSFIIFVYFYFLAAGVSCEDRIWAQCQGHLAPFPS